ncbi:DUF2268 domain-containing putative Zn-dependent protease [Sphingomonas sp. DT-207]|uniref:DUF2268 domain-containing putative Zn-dependent protease n=1 Tax=Sphingomonas sp. DT-207 TaxID=3396167 RepID=UPI003F1D93CD
MIRTLCAAAALLVAASATAQPAPTPSFASYVDAFDTFATETATMPEAERARAFSARFNALVPGFYAPRNGATEAKYDARVARVLAYYPAHRERFLAAARNFTTSYATANDRFRQVFPDYAPTMPIYLLHSLGEMDGGTRELEGRVVAVFGGDVIARIHDSSTIAPFLDHELFHFHHARFFPDCEALWCSLWQEGLATYVAARMNPEADDRALLLTIPRPIRAEVDPRLGEAMCLTLAKLDSTAPDDYSGFFFGDGKGTGFPPRFGYYVGYRLAQKLGEGRSLQQLAALSPDKVRLMLRAAIEDFAACPQ